MLKVSWDVPTFFSSSKTRNQYQNRTWVLKIIVFKWV